MKIYTFTFLFLFSIILINPVLAEVSADRDFATTFDLNSAVVSPRANALGGAFEAIADDSTAAYYNPAGLSQLYSMNVDLGGGILSADRMFFHVGYAHPFASLGVFSIGVKYFRSADMEETDESGNLLGKSFSSQDIGVALAYGRDLNMLLYGLNAGVRVEYLYNTILDEGYSGYTVSYGLLYNFYRIPSLRYLSTGLVIENIPGVIKWTTDTEDTITSKLKFGVAYRLFRDRLILSGHLVYEKDVPVEWAIGTEYNYKNILLRLGGQPYFYNTGIGFRYEVYEINYSLNIDDIGYNHYVALNYKFGGQVEEEMRSKIMTEIITTKAEDHYNEGLFDLDNNRFDEALQEFQLALLWNPDMSGAEDKLEETKNKAKEAKARGDLKEPTFKTTCPSAKELLKHYYAGINAYMKNDLELALKEWRFVARCDPENEKVKINIHKAEIKLKEMKK
ncbi:MAG: hypothetical protein JW827_04060 [Spirochaetes bacterium]|nr:hypothetical protein [Spirochaetota bacterium]